MATRQFKRSISLPVSAREAFAWHERPRALQRLLPPWQNAVVLKAPKNLRPGSEAVIRLRVGPFTRTWLAEHRHFAPGTLFTDAQVTGPFAKWNHTHRFRPIDDQNCVMEDEIRYKLPLAPISDAILGRFVDRELERTFTYRQNTTRADLLAICRQEVVPMRVLITGSTGLIGSELTNFLSAGGHAVTRISRSAASLDGPGISWDYQSSLRDRLDEIEGHDVIIHLAGENIASKRWTPDQKRRIRRSRVDSTRLLAEAIAACENKPRLFLTASAVGIYGDRGEQWVDEETPAGEGFLAEVGSEWEEAASAARENGVRTAHLRFGVVLSPKGGALKKMLPAFRIGLGGRLGDGKQYMSWIALDDVIGAIHHASQNDQLSGAINVVTPNPVTNEEFARTLARVLGRPVGPPAPALALQLAFGEMANEALLASVRVKPSKLERSGYTFRYPHLEKALRHLLGKSE